MLIKGYVAQIKIKMKQRPKDTKTTLKQIHISFVRQSATHILVTTTLQEGTVQKWVMQIKDTAQLQGNTENEQQKPRQSYSTTRRIKIETVRHVKFRGITTCNCKWSKSVHFCFLRLAVMKHHLEERWRHAKPRWTEFPINAQIAHVRLWRCIAFPRA